MNAAESSDPYANAAGLMASHMLFYHRVNMNLLIGQEARLRLLERVNIELYQVCNLGVCHVFYAYA